MNNKIKDLLPYLLGGVVIISILIGTFLFLTKEEPNQTTNTITTPPLATEITTTNSLTITEVPQKTVNYPNINQYLLDTIANVQKAFKNGELKKNTYVSSYLFTSEEYDIDFESYNNNIVHYIQLVGKTTSCTKNASLSDPIAVDLLSKTGFEVSKLPAPDTNNTGDSLWYDYNGAKLQVACVGDGNLAVTYYTEDY